MVKGTKKPPSNPAGRPEGELNPRSLEAIRKKRGRIYAALLAKAVAGDSLAGRTCLELIGDLPRGFVPNAAEEDLAIVVSKG